MRILAVLGIEMTACMTILDRITRLPTAREARLTQRAGSAEIKQKGNASWAAYGALSLSEDRPRAIAGANRAGKANA